MTEQQKQVIFLSNCIYQLESQREKINNNEPISIDILELISESLSITLKTEKGA